jgi:hypothetical protein
MDVVDDLDVATGQGCSEPDRWRRLISPPLSLTGVLIRESVTSDVEEKVRPGGELTLCFRLSAGLA